MPNPFVPVRNGAEGFRLEGRGALSCIPWMLPNDAKFASSVGDFFNVPFFRWKASSELLSQKLNPYKYKAFQLVYPPSSECRELIWDALSVGLFPKNFSETALRRDLRIIGY